MSMSLLRIEPSTTPPSSVTWTEIREVDQAELDEIERSISFARQYAQRYTVQLVFSGKAAFDQAVAKLHQPLPAQVAQVVAGEIEVALVSFLLMWRLFVDQTRHDLSQRFGDQSANYNRFITATNTEYGTRPGYRLVEGLRNYVQHIGMPGLKSSSIRRQDAGDEPAIVTDATVMLPRENLLEALRRSKGQRLLREDLEQSTDPLPIIDLLDDAMQGFNELVRVLIEIDSPELIQSLKRIKALADETAPGAGVLADLDSFTAGGGSVTMTRFDDLYRFFPLIELPEANQQ